MKGHQPFAISFSFFIARQGKSDFLNSRCGVVVDAVLGDGDATRGIGAGDIKHDIQHGVLDDALQGTGAGLSFNGFLCHGPECRLIKLQINLVHLHQLLVLLDRGVARLRENAQQGVLIQGFQGADNWQAADDFRDDAELHQILRRYLMDELVVPQSWRRSRYWSRFSSASWR